MYVAECQHVALPVSAPSGKKISERFCDKLGEEADRGEVVAVRDTFGESKKRTDWREK